MRDARLPARAQPPRRLPAASRPPSGSRTRPGTAAAADPGRARPRTRLPPRTRRRHGDGHKTPAPGAPANESARRGETRTSLFQDGGAAVASSRAGGKPAEPSAAAARDGAEAAVAAVGGGPGRFRRCDGRCHAAGLGRTSLPRRVMMLTEVSGAHRPPGTDAAPGRWARPAAARPGPAASEWARC